jgi:hypothetical protein
MQIVVDDDALVKRILDRICLRANGKDLQRQIKPVQSDIVGAHNSVL